MGNNDKPLGMSGGVPAGWVLVPVEPTEAMVEAGRWPAEDDGPSACWSAMLDAVPTPAPPIEGRDADVERFCNPIVTCVDDEVYVLFDAPDQSIAPFCLDRDHAQALHAALSAALQALGER